MNNMIIDWEYYNSLYSNIDEGDFNKLEKLAEKQIKLVIGTPKWNSINPNAFYYDQLRDCICKVINKLVEYDKSGIGKGIASVSNDGYSENYTVQTAEQAMAEIRNYINGWLSGTGLIGAYKC